MFDPKSVNQNPSQAPNAAPAVAAQTMTNAQEIIESEKAYEKGEDTVRDIIAPASMRVQADHLELNGRFVRTVFVTQYPRYINVGWFSPIINLSATMDIAMYFYPVSSDIVLNQLKKKVGNLEAQLIEDQEKGAPRDPMRQTALQDIEQLRDALTQGTEHFFQ